MGDTERRDNWIQGLIVASCAAFVFVLALSAIFDPSIRVLHVFQAGIYVAVAVLARKHSAWGYGVGCLTAAYWNYTNLVHTTFIADGFRELSSALQTGQIRQPDQLVSVFAAAAHFLLIACCVIGYLQIRPKTVWNSARFFGGGVLAIAYFAAIIGLFGQQYVPLLRQSFGL